MTPRPRPVERLEKTLARVARERGLDQERLRRWVSFLALCGVLERALEERILGSYFLKGGVALELRFATQARATKDLDLGLEGPRGSRVDLLSRALALGFDAFAFRVKAQTRDMEQADTVRVNVTVTYRTRAWQTVEIDLGPAGGQAIDLVDPRVAGLADLGLPVTSPVRCLGLAEQAAQKIHACTTPHTTGRARDILDILLMDTLAGLDYDQTAAAVQRVFTARATHAFSPEFSLPPEWRPELESLAAQLGLAEASAPAVEAKFRDVLRRIAGATR
ncbi:MAG: nucleotidyl transferase AbiEii/AbiGii toxin family protein [Bryobacterales bacterium]|nr:nucleotidyl transferase AbiEii/AbiGii toxin family protein [Bryobacterales bacterium]